MSEVGLLFVREDRAAAQALTAALVAEGYDVCACASVIDDPAAYMAVLALLSPAAARSPTAIAAAQRAHKENRLIAALTQFCALPAGFESLTLHDLSHWGHGAHEAAVTPIILQLRRLERSRDAGRAVRQTFAPAPPPPAPPIFATAPASAASRAASVIDGVRPTAVHATPGRAWTVEQGAPEPLQAARPSGADRPLREGRGGGEPSPPGTTWRPLAPPQDVAGAQAALRRRHAFEDQWLGAAGPSAAPPQPSIDVAAAAAARRARLARELEAHQGGGGVEEAEARRRGPKAPWNGAGPGRGTPLWSTSWPPKPPE